MRPQEILLHVPRGLGRSVYQFTCPTCLDRVEKVADRKVVALLVSAGVDLATPETLLGESGETVTHPEPLDAMDTSPGGRAFTPDDLLDFHFLLLDERHIEEFLQSQP